MNELAQKVLRRNVTEAWNSALANLAHIGVRGTLTAEISNRIAEVLDEDRRPSRRSEVAAEVRQIVTPLAEALSAFDGVTVESFTVAGKAAEHLGEVVMGLVALGKFLDEAAAERLADAYPNSAEPNRT